MFGSWFYHQRIRKSVAVFGSLFNNINVIRKNSGGGTLSQVKVPLSYGPSRNFLERIAQMDNGENQERQVAIKLPRMSFEILAMNYDPSRQLPKMNSMAMASSASTAYKMYTPVPYNIQFQLSVYAKNQDDALQVVEQILPYFTPQYTVTMKPLDDFPDVKEDVPIKLEAITFSDDYEGSLDARRTIVYQLDFDMKINLYKRINDASSVINDVEVSYYDYDDETKLLSYFAMSANDPRGNTGSGSRSGEDITGTLIIDNTIEPITGDAFAISSDPLYGSATIDSQTGVWVYTPDNSYTGIVTFQVAVEVGMGVTETFTITLTIN